MANYAHIENNTITGVYDLLPENWRNISNFFALESETDYIRSLGWRLVQKTTPEYNVHTQRLGPPTHQIVDDEVVEIYPVIDNPVEIEVQPILPTEEEIAQHNMQLHTDAMEKLRVKRDELLTKTDFTQLADVVAINGPTLTQLFVDYRQALRDLPIVYANDMTFLDESQAVYPTYPTDSQPGGV